MKTQFKVYCPDVHGEDEFELIEGFDAEHAAEEYGEQFDSEGDYSLIGGADIEVRVTDPAGTYKWFTVSGEIAHVYRAEWAPDRDKKEE